MFERSSGVLLHPTSLPGPHGIGDLGDGAYHFLDWMHAAGQQLWQIMPLGVTGAGNSPYASPSAFAGNPLLVSLEVLAREGLLIGEDFHDYPHLSEHHVDFGAVIPAKERMLRRAFARWVAAGGADSPAFAAFRAAVAGWLDDFALFMAIKDASGGGSWQSWDDATRLRDTATLARWRAQLADDVLFHAFVQFQFRTQWQRVRDYANERGIRVVGDVPIFVALDSADVWAHRELFRLDAAGNPTVVAGVPPDYFSTTGQLWGNPVFDWAANRAEGYRWWTARMQGLLDVVDIVRIDHFRGFAANWSVPAGDATAAGGAWTQGPGAEIFAAFRATLGTVPVIVEDLGLITPDVHALRRELGYPGMAVLQFAFSDDPDNAYLPHNHAENLVVYTGTHDNDTTIGWFTSLPYAQMIEVQTYLGRDGSDIAWDLLRLAWSSVATVAIAPLQDVLRRGGEARMNVPGKADGNWAWRYRAGDLHEGLAAGLAEFTHTYGRARREAAEKTYDPYDYSAPETAHPVQ
jgi:4-alpha-glucanotransferase